MYEDKTFKRIVFSLTVVVVVGLAGFIGYQIYQASYFHITGTNPSTKKVATITPFFKINFNRTLNKNSLKLSSLPIIISSYSVVGKEIDIYLRGPLNPSLTYRIILGAIADQSGSLVQNVTFSFSPKIIPSNDIPQDQRQYLLNQQQVQPSKKSGIGFSGIDQLSNYGVSDPQLGALQQAFYNFDNSAKFVVVDIGTINVAPHDPNSASTSSTIYFQVSIDNTSYNATLTYENLNVIDLVLAKASTGQQVFDSGQLSD